MNRDEVRDHNGHMIEEYLRHLQVGDCMLQGCMYTRLEGTHVVWGAWFAGNRYEGQELMRLLCLLIGGLNHFLPTAPPEMAGPKMRPGKPQTAN